MHKVLSLDPDQLRGGLYTSSTGNHALAVVHACKQAAARAGCAVPLTVYLPTSAAPSKIAKLKEAGAEVVFHGQDCVEAEAEARRVAAQRGGVYVSPYNDMQVRMAAQRSAPQRSGGGWGYWRCVQCVLHALCTLAACAALLSCGRASQQAAQGHVARVAAPAAPAHR